MKFKKQLIVLSLFLLSFISFPSPSYAYDFDGYDVDSYQHIVCLRLVFSSLENGVKYDVDQRYYIFSTTPININETINISNVGPNIIACSVSSPHAFLSYKYVNGDVVKNNFGIVNTFSDGINYNIGSNASNINVSYVVVRGSVSVSDECDIVSGSFDSAIDDSKIPSFDWSGDGVKIYRPSDKQEISGYQSGGSTMKWFDSVVYGKMTVDKEALPVYVGTSITLKSLKTVIQNSTIGRIGNETRRSGEGLGIKNFEWVDSPSSIKQGDVLKFKMTIQMPMLEMGVHDFTVGVSMPTTKNYEYFSDTKKDINFLIDNKDDNFYEPPPSGGSSGEVNGSDNDYSGNGSSSGGNDSMGGFPDSDNYEDTILGKLAYFRDLCLWLILFPFNFLISAFDTLTGYIKQMVNILSPFSAEMDKLFSFIPEDIRKVCWGSLSMMLLYSLVKGVSRLFRGR